MYMLKSVVSLALFTVAAIAQSTNLQFTTFPATSLAAGSPVTLSWIGGDSNAPVTITLKKGLSTDLKDVGVITSTATGGSYTWTPDTSITNGADYALAISQGSVINYTGQFSVTGGSNAAATTASGASSASSAAASSTGSITSAAAAISTTASSSNGTVSSAALSATDSSASASGTSTLRTSSTSRTATSSSTTGTSSSVPATGSASGLQSPIALFFGVVAAMLYLQ